MGKNYANQFVIEKNMTLKQEIRSSWENEFQMQVNE